MTDRPRYVVARQIQRGAPTDLERLRAAGSATVHEAIGRQGYLGPEIRPIQRDVSICGSAVTVQCHPGDNLMIHAAIEWCQPGDVLVVTTTAPSTHGMFGDLLATALIARGVVGLVIDAGVRDTATLRADRFPVWARHVSCEGTVKASPGCVNVPVTIGSSIIHPGDAVCADDDGVVVIARAAIPSAIEASERREANERVIRARLAGGEPSLDVFGLRPLLDQLGVVHVDRIDEISEQGSNAGSER